jgi:hypothetical protein
LETGSSEAALDVETLVGLTAVQNALVAANLLGDVVECLDDSETKLLALLVLCDGDILDVADGAKAVDTVKELVSVVARRIAGRIDLQLALGDQSSGSYNRSLCARSVLDDDDVVAASSGHVIILLNEVVLGDIADGGQDAQAVEETAVEVGLAQSA